MEINQKYSGNDLRLAIRYRKAGIPESYWFKAHRNYHQDEDKKRFKAIFSRDTDSLASFIADMVKRRPQDNPSYVDFTALLMKLRGKYDKWDAVGDMDFGMLAVVNIRPSQYLKESAGAFTAYLSKAMTTHNARIVLGFVGYINTTISKINFLTNLAFQIPPCFL